MKNTVDYYREFYMGWAELQGRTDAFVKNPIPTIERMNDEGMEIDESTLSILTDSKCFERDDEQEQHAK